jgi:hypothetical protein
MSTVHTGMEWVDQPGDHVVLNCHVENEHFDSVELL